LTVIEPLEVELKNCNCGQPVEKGYSKCKSCWWGSDPRNKNGKWFGRIGYDNEGIVCEKEFKTEAEAKAYEQGASDMQKECDNGVSEGEFSPLEDYWTAYSAQESIAES